MGQGKEDVRNRKCFTTKKINRVRENNQRYIHERSLHRTKQTSTTLYKSRPYNDATYNYSSTVLLNLREFSVAFPSFIAESATGNKYSQQQIQNFKQCRQRNLSRDLTSSTNIMSLNKQLYIHSVIRAVGASVGSEDSKIRFLPEGLQ